MIEKRRLISMSVKSIAKRVSHIIPDTLYLRMKYRMRTGKRLHLSNPSTYSEKLQWMKVYDRKPLYTTVVDKYEVKKFVAEKLGEEYVVPLIGVWDHVDDIPFDELPNQFVLKCTHDSGGLQICKDKATFDFEAAKKKIREVLKTDYYWASREWPYKNVKPRVIAEQYLEDAATGETRDYKFFTFQGEPKVMYIATGRGCGATYADFFDMDFNHLELDIDHVNAPEAPLKPVCFEEMKKAAAVLAQGFPQVRVDFYEINGKVYFGEMTFFHCGGFINFTPDHWNKTFGDWMGECKRSENT
jgi:hypothetical protein